jgi:hypothetical protein
MRLFSIALLAGVVFAAESQAQVGYYRSRAYVSPYYPAAYRYSSFASPYGYRTFSSYGVTPTVYGPSTFYRTGTTIRPFYTGPVHSVYFDPFAGNYRYGTGYLNTPSFYFQTVRPAYYAPYTPYPYTPYPYGPSPYTPLYTPYSPY